MPRQRRLHLPNAGFHITARTQNGAAYFTPEVRTRIAIDIEDAVAAHKHTMLAHAVMPNHFHIVLKQGNAPLGWVMQRIMQRAVVHVRRAHGGEGHVFGRPYWACVCANPAYLRRAIIYTHLNPVKAGLCQTVDDYTWSTHRCYVENHGHSNASKRSLLIEGRMLFADESITRDDLRQNYTRFIEFCNFQRAKGIPGDWLLPEGPQRMLIPGAAHGDTYWAANYSAFTEAASFTRVNIDVARPAAALLSRLDSRVTLDMIRAVDRSATLCAVRKQLIEGLIIHGCRTSAISRCLGTSLSIVSRVKSSMCNPASSQR